MVKKRERQTTEQKIEAFANAIEPSIITAESKRERKYKRVTLSLTEHEDQLLDELSLKVRTFRCNRSQVVKAALALLSEQDEQTLIHLLEQQK